MKNIISVKCDYVANFKKTFHANLYSVYTMGLHLWDTGSMGVPIENQYG